MPADSHHRENPSPRPTQIGANGHRHYGTAELVRLQQILFFREPAFPLDRIRELLDRPGFDATSAYRDHRRQLVTRRDQLDDVIATVDVQLIPEGIDDMTTNDSPVYGRFTETEMDGLRAEAKQRWGDTDAWRQSQGRTRDMGPPTSSGSTRSWRRSWGTRRRDAGWRRLTGRPAADR